MSNLVSIRRPPSDLPQLLRDLADKAERGEITDMVTAYIYADNYEFTYSASLNDCILLSTLLQRACVDRMRR